MMENENTAFKVSNPTLMGGHISYFVKGQDQKGDFEGTRRYNDFFVLRGALANRWPGVYVPKVPPKKAIVIPLTLSSSQGNKDTKFINERMFYLEKFLRKLGNQKHFVQSEEFQLFSKPVGDIDKTLGKLPKLAT